VGDVEIFLFPPLRPAPP